MGEDPARRRLTTCGPAGPQEVGRERAGRTLELFFERLEHLSPEAEFELRHPDYVMEMPQSGERIRGRDNMRAFQEAYPNPDHPTAAGCWIR